MKTNVITYIKHLSAALFLFVILSGCVSTKREVISAEKESTDIRQHLRGDAYLFDTKIIRNSKKNSVRLDVYLRNDSISVFARGYLGKGVLKGIISADSATVYFPTMKEFFSGPLNELLKDECHQIRPMESDLIRIFKHIPVKYPEINNNYKISTIEDSDKEKKYILNSLSCSNSIIVDYKFKKDSFVLSGFNYKNSDGTLEIISTLRKYRGNVKISSKKFNLNIPKSAVRVYP
jgi:hypothetical protein